MTHEATSNESLQTFVSGDQISVQTYKMSIPLVYFSQHFCNTLRGHNARMERRRPSDDQLSRSKQKTCTMGIG
jgi:hypothetical protein